MKQKIIKIGDSYGITLSKKILEEMNMKLGEEVTVNYETSKGKITVEPKVKVNNELMDWTDNFIKKYRKDLDKLADE
jgi:antitoxin component of MazEF toxin-antitoxin module